MASKTQKSIFFQFFLAAGFLFVNLVTSNVDAKTLAPLKIAMLPIIDSLPYYVAEANGAFKKAGIDVQLIPVMSGLNRDQLMQAGEVDGMLNEMTTVGNFNRKTVQVKVVYSIRSAQANYPMFRLIASPGSKLTQVSDLSGASIGISKNTIIEYMTDRVLEAKGLNPEDTNKRSIPAIPERFQLLMQGQIDTAVLPDPLGQAALASGAKLIFDDSADPRYSVSLFTFSVDSIQTKTETLKRFLKVWENAVTRLNSSPESYRALMLRKIRVPPNVQKNYSIPRFSKSSVPSEEQWNDVMKWMVQKGLLKTSLSYDSSVTAEFLPVKPQ